MQCQNRVWPKLPSSAAKAYPTREHQAVRQSRDDIVENSAMAEIRLLKGKGRRYVVIYGLLVV